MCSAPAQVPSGSRSSPLTLLIADRLSIIVYVLVDPDRRHCSSLLRQLAEGSTKEAVWKKRLMPRLQSQTEGRKGEQDGYALVAAQDSSEEGELTLAEPEPEAVATAFDMSIDAMSDGEGLELQITRKISAFMHGKTKQQQGKSDPEEFAGAMAAIPGLQKRGGSTNLAKVPVKMDDRIDPVYVVKMANQILASSGDTIEVESLLLDGISLDTCEGKRWTELAEHIKGEKGTRTLVLQAQLVSIDKQNVAHMLAMSKKDNHPERVTTGTSPAGTPNCAVDPLSRSVPVRAAFRLQKLSNVDLDTRQFVASFYLELQWVEQRPDGVDGQLLKGRPRAASTPRDLLPRSSSTGGLAAIEPPTASKYEFQPKVFLENKVGDKRVDGWAYEHCTCASVEQLQRFWAVDPEAVKVDDFTLFRAHWNSSATFSIEDSDIWDAPLDPVTLKIKIRCEYNTSKVIPQETMSGLLMPTVVAQEGHVSFIKVDTGQVRLTSTCSHATHFLIQNLKIPCVQQQYIDRSLMETALNCVKGSFRVSSKVPTQYNIADVVAKADQPAIDLCFEYKERLLPHRVSLVLPSAMIGVVAMASVWFADKDDSALTNAVLLVGAALRISPGGRGGMKTLGTINLFLVSTVVFVSVLTVADLAKAKYDDSETVAKAMPIVQLVCFGLWLIPTVLLWFTRVSLNRFLRPPAPSKSKHKPLPASIVNMTGSLLHTQWRKDRADGFNGELVPRWKTIDASECACSSQCILLLSTCVFSLYPLSECCICILRSR